MRFPDSIYELSGPEIAKASWSPQRVIAGVGSSGTSIQLLRRFGPVPRDRALIITTATMLSEAGAGQLATAMLMTVVDENGVTLGNIALRRPQSQFGELNFSGEHTVLDAEFVQFIANFDAGVAVNTLTVGFSGYLVPRANYQFGSVPLV